MSAKEIRERLQTLSTKYPKTLRIIRSPSEIDRIDLYNAEFRGPFDNDSITSISTLEEALSAGKQAAIQAAGSNQVLVLVPKRGSTFFK
jgi:hypothetical protein